MRAPIALLLALAAPLAACEGDPAPQGPVTCAFAADPSGPYQEVNTHSADVPRVTFTVRGLPDGVERAELRYTAHDADHPGREGWIEVNGQPRIALPADAALDNLDRAFVVDVSGRTVAGDNRVDFIADEGPEGAFYRISGLSLVVTGEGLPCGEPAPGPQPGQLVEHPAPAGISAFAALAPDFPRADTLAVLGGLQRPFTTVLLDFEPVYARAGVQMFLPGNIGARQPNPAHFAALADFVRAYADATPRAAERHLQLYVLNGPGIRRDGYARAYPLGPEALGDALVNDGAIRAELQGYLTQLTAAVAPFRDRVVLRLAVALEDDFTRPQARAIRDLARAAGWPDAIGRNPCGCGRGDRRRMGDFVEDHPHGLAAIDALPDRLMGSDSFSNDGWGFTVADGTGRTVDAAAVTAMARAASETGLFFHLWYDPIQGYPIPADGNRRLIFFHPPADVLGWLAAGLSAGPVAPDPGPEPGPVGTGNGVERSMGYRDATYDQRRNWVLDCRDYAYTGRGDEHEACDARYNPDGSTHGRAIFAFEGVIDDLYDVFVEGRHTENRNPAGMLTIVDGVERRIPQNDDRDMVWDLHGRHRLSGRVEVIIDSTRENGSDAVRAVRLTPVR